MDPTQHHMGYPPPHAVAARAHAQQGYYGAPLYQQMPLGPVPPYLPAAQGYGQQYPQYQGWLLHTPYFPASPTAPLPVLAPTYKTAKTPVKAPPTHTQFVNSQHEPGGKSASVYVCENHLPYLPVWESETNITSSEAKQVFMAHSSIVTTCDDVQFFFDFYSFLFITCTFIVSHMTDNLPFLT